MPLVNLDQAPSRSMQRWFGLSLAILLAIIAVTISQVNSTVAWMVGAVALGEALAYYSIPKTQVPIIRAWQIITFPIAWTVGHILLGIVFWFVVLPLGLGLRMLKYDPLRLRSDNSTSNWQNRPDKKPADSYFKQF